LVDDVRASGADVIVTTVLPSTGDAPLARRIYWSPRIEAAVGQVNAELRRWAGDGVQVLDAAALLEDGRGQLRREYSIDLLHLNDAGYAVLNRELARLVAQPDR
jgi:lysophospholipase L1-like esterase